MVCYMNVSRLYVILFIIKKTDQSLTIFSFFGLGHTQAQKPKNFPKKVGNLLRKTDLIVVGNTHE